MPTDLSTSPELNADLAAPVYRRIELDLRRKIRTKEWPAGMMLPGRQRLSLEYNVHHRTIDRAIRALVADGSLETQGTRGTFVASSATELAGNGAVADNHALRDRWRAEPPGWETRLSRQRTLAIVSTDYEFSRDSQAILHSIEKCFSRAGGSISFIDRTPPGQNAIGVDEAVTTLLDWGCDAMVVLTYNDLRLPLDRFDALLKYASIPVVHVSSVSAGRPIWNVYYDSVDAGYQAASHLLSKGCRSFAYIACEYAQWAEERLRGIRAAIAGALPSGDALHVHYEDADKKGDPFHTEAARKAAHALFERGGAQGIIAVNDHAANGVLIAGQERGLKAGVDFLLVGFDDSDVARSRGISSMRPPREEMGASAAMLAVRALEGDTVCQRICLSSHLIARATTHGTFLR